MMSKKIATLITDLFEDVNSLNRQKHLKMLVIKCSQSIYRLEKLLLEKKVNQ